MRCWDLFLENPFFGVGLGGVGKELYMQHHFGDAAVLLTNPTLEQLEPFDPMNVTTEILASLGLFGTFAFALLLFRCAKYLRPHTPFFLSTIVMLTALQFNQGLFRPYVWVHLALALGYVHKKSGARTPLSEKRDYSPASVSDGAVKGCIEGASAST